MSFRKPRRWIVVVFATLAAAVGAAVPAPAELSALKNPDIIAIDQSGSPPATAITSGHIEAVIKKADGGEAVLLANTGSGSGSGTFTLSQLGIGTAQATGYNVWKNETTTFSGVTVTLPAGQTETLVIKPTGA